MRYMLDTNICIYLMKQHPPEVAARFASLATGDAVISAVTLAELSAGLQRNAATRAHNARVLDRLVEWVVVMPFDAGAAHAFGGLHGTTRARQRDAYDRLIAAHAVSVGATLVTNNEADFKGYPGLVVENWVLQATP